MGVRGLEATLRVFQRLPQALKEDVKDAVEEVTQDIYREARLLAPGAGDQLQTQHYRNNSNTNKKIERI